MRVCSLASSSKGNSFLVFSENTKILFDDGLLLCDLEAKLRKLNISAESINAVVVSHEHSDHIKGVGPLLRKYKNISCYIYEKGLNYSLSKLGRVNANQLVAFSLVPFTIGDFLITAFEVPHDSKTCVGFNVFKDNKKISIITDLGHANDKIVENLYNSRLVYLESNHDEQVLYANKNYSYFLKTRILGLKGHLSNNAAAKVVSLLACNNVKQVVLAHLSEENNSYELCYSTICNYLKSVGINPNVNIKIDIAKKTDVGTLFHIV